MDKTRLTAIVLTAAITLSGCAERGYRLSVEPSTHTATAQTATDIRKHSESTIKETFKKMEKAVKKALIQTEKKEHETSRIQKEQKVERIQAENEHLKALRVQKRLEKEKAAEAVKKQKIAEEKKHLALLEKQKAQSILAQQRKKEQAEAAQKEADKLKAQEEQRLLNKEAEKKAKELARQKEKIKVMEEEKKRQEEAKKAQIEKEKLEQIRKEKEKTRRIKEKKLKDALMKEEERSYNRPKPIVSHTNFSDPVSFIYLNKTYHKFGTSEIHGHVVYVSPSGGEIQLDNAKVYLLPVGANLNFWYKNFYLKNKDFGFKKLKAYYLNKTGLDLDRNFAFYGVPAGSYYIIIEATHPISKNKKIYIAKKIDVGKYKKVMAVFSKRL